MSVETLNRILWRLRSHKPGSSDFIDTELRRAIILEAGYDVRTYKRIRKALTQLQWIKKGKNNRSIVLTNKDLTGDL